MSTMTRLSELQTPRPSLLARALSRLFPYRAEETGWKIVMYQMAIATSGKGVGRCGPDLDAL